MNAFSIPNFTNILNLLKLKMNFLKVQEGEYVNDNFCLQNEKILMIYPRFATISI